MANVQLMPDPTILSLETGTRHRTAERVSKQTDALVIAISQRREVVSLYVDGGKYILEEIPVVLAKANQALATLDKYRTRLDQVSTRLTALEFEGGATLHDVLTVLQRSELVTRMAVEIERYIVELGTEGRLIEMQLEETMVGTAADKAALVHDYLAENTDEAFAGALDQIGRLPHQDLLDFGRLAELLGYDRKLNTLDYPVSPRGFRILGRIPRLPKLVVAQIVMDFGGLDEMLAATDAELETVEGSGRSGRRTSARAFAGCRRSTSWTVTCRRDAPRTAHHRSRPAPAPTKEDTISEAIEEQLLEDLRGPHDREHRVRARRQRRVPAPRGRPGPEEGTAQDVRRGARVPHDQDPAQRHDRDGPVRERRRRGAAPRHRRGDREKVLAVLADEVSEMPKNWNRRFKHNRDKIKTGDIYELAEVVRNLAIREHEKGLSTGEKQMFTRAKKILASELMYALDKDEDEAEQHLDDLLAESAGVVAK